MDWTSARDLVADKIGDRRLIWLGLAGQDAVPLVDIPQFQYSYSLHSRLRADGVESFDVESLIGWRRRDFDIGLFLNEKGTPLVESFQRAVSQPSVLVSGSSYEFIDFLLMVGQTEYLGNSYATFQEVSRKRVVEAELGKEGSVPTIPWRHLPPGSERIPELQAELRRGPIVLRSGKQDSGAGHELVRDEGELDASAVARLEEEISVGPFLEEHVPVCVGGCVFPDGGITVHTPSFQLIGIQGCTPFDFGYCGNDFGAVKRLSTAALERIETCVREAGVWLYRKGFVGAFGVDVLVRGDAVVFVEINPRFQGSSLMSAELDREMGLPDVYLDHLMAWLGLPSRVSPPVAQQVAAQRARSHVTCCNLLPGPVSLRQTGIDLPPGFAAELLPDPAVRVGSRHLLCDLITDGSVTSDGKSVTASARKAIDASLAAFTPNE